MKAQCVMHKIYLPSQQTNIVDSDQDSAGSAVSSHRVPATTTSDFRRALPAQAVMDAPHLSCLPPPSLRSNNCTHARVFAYRLFIANAVATSPHLRPSDFDKKPNSTPPWVPSRCYCSPLESIRQHHLQLGDPSAQTQKIRHSQ